MTLRSHNLEEQIHLIPSIASFTIREDSFLLDSCSRGKWGKLCHLNCPLLKEKCAKGAINTSDYISGCMLSTEIRGTHL